MILPYLIISHLIGDFVVQPSWLVRWKISSAWGIVVHGLIHFIVMTVVFTPFMINGHMELIYMILGLTVFHLLIDYSKISYDLKHDAKVKAFVVDQVLHIITILIAAMIFVDLSVVFPATKFYQVYTSPSVISFIAMLIFVTEVYEIYKFQFEREKNSRARLKINSRQVSIRVIVFTLLYLILMGLAFGFEHFSG